MWSEQSNPFALFFVRPYCWPTVRLNSQSLHRRLLLPFDLLRVCQGYLEDRHQNWAEKALGRSVMPLPSLIQYTVTFSLLLKRVTMSGFDHRHWQIRSGLKKEEEKKRWQDYALWRHASLVWGHIHTLRHFFLKYTAESKSASTSQF